MTYHHNHKALKAMCLRLLGHLDTVVSDIDNMWYYFFFVMPQLMGLRYSPVLKQNLIQTLNLIKSYHMMN